MRFDVDEEEERHRRRSRTSHRCVRVSLVAARRLVRVREIVAVRPNELVAALWLDQVREIVAARDRTRVDSLKSSESRCEVL